MLPTVISTIIEQLGGRRIFAMAFTGSSYWLDSPGGPKLSLKIAPALVRGVPGKATHVDVVLDASDLYTVSLSRVWKRHPGGETLTAVGDVYCDRLKGVVEEMTGLALSL